MTDPFEANARADREAADLLCRHLDGNEPITRHHLNDAMAQAFGGSDADGRWTQRVGAAIKHYALKKYYLFTKSNGVPFSESVFRKLMCKTGRVPLAAFQLRTGPTAYRRSAVIHAGNADGGWVSDCQVLFPETL